MGGGYSDQWKCHIVTIIITSSKEMLTCEDCAKFLAFHGLPVDNRNDSKAGAHLLIPE